MPESMRDLCEQKEEVWARNSRPNFGRQSDFHVIAGFFNMPQSCDMGQTALLPFRRKACWGFCRPKNPTASAWFEPANLGTRGQFGGFTCGKSATHVSWAATDTTWTAPADAWTQPGTFHERANNYIKPTHHLLVLTFRSKYACFEKGKVLTLWNT
jgi:hypothetical protein